MKALRFALAGGMVLLLAGCATTQQGSPVSAGPGGGETGTVDLNLCVYTSKTDFGGDYVNRHKFADAGSEPSFQSVRNVESLSEITGCDLMVELTLGSGIILPGVSNKNANVYSAYGDRQVPIKEYGHGRKPLMVAEAASADLFPGMDSTPHKLRREVYHAFRKGTPLYARVAAERDAQRRQEQAQEQVAEAPGSVGEFGGVGLQIGGRPENYEPFTVIATIEGTPADRAGIKAGDRILKVNDESTQNMTTVAAVQRLRGLKGTKVTLTLVRDGAPEPITVTLVREIITKVEAKRDAPQLEAAQKQPATGGVSKAEMQALLKEAMKEAAQPPRAPGPPTLAPAITSDIDHPVFTTAEQALGEHDVAVVIGVEKYRDLPGAEYAANDARLVKEYLVALGLKERNIQLLVDERATRTDIKKTLETWLPNHVKKESRVVVYYSGHGSPDTATGAAYIVPHDGDPNYLADTGYPLKNLYEKLGTLPAQEVVVLLDACFSGAGGRSVLAKGHKPMMVAREGDVVPPKMVVLAATQGAQISTSAAEKGHGLFTYHFLKALKDGKKDIVEIYQHIQPLVEDEANVLNVKQSPSLNPEPRLAQVRFRLRN